MKINLLEPEIKDNKKINKTSEQRKGNNLIKIIKY